MQPAARKIKCTRKLQKLKEGKGNKAASERKRETAAEREIEREREHNRSQKLMELIVRRKAATLKEREGGRGVTMGIVQPKVKCQCQAQVAAALRVIGATAALLQPSSSSSSPMV